MQIIMRAAAALVLILGLTACETIKGAGRDIENAGEEIDEEL